MSILLGGVTTGGAWTFDLGPRLDTGDFGPSFVTSSDQNNDGVPDIIAVSSQGGTATLLPGVGDGFFNDTNPQTLNFGSSVLDLSGAFALLGDGRVVGFNFAAGISTLFTADAGREGNALQASTLDGFAFPLLFTANDDGTVSALGSLDGINYREVASATGNLDNPSALAVLQSGNDVEVYVSDTGESDLVVLSFGTEDLVAGLTSVGGSLALVATLTNSLDNTTVSSLVVQSLLEDFSSAIDAELVFGGEDAGSESGPSDSVLASLLDALLDAGGNAEAEAEFVSLTEEAAIEPMSLQQFISGLKDALRDAGWKREEDADRVGTILAQMDSRDVEKLLRRGQDVIDKIVIFFRAWSKQANAPTMRELPMTPPNEMAPVPDREEEINNGLFDEFFSASDFDRWFDSETPWNSPELRDKGNEEASIGSLLSTLSSAVFASWVQRTPSYRLDSTKKRLLSRWY